MESWGASPSPRRVYVIAEMACSHDGCLDHAKAIVTGAGDAGADAIQLQIWKAENMVVPHHPDHGKLRSLELGEEQWSELVAFTRKRYPSLEIIACVYDSQAVDFARGLGIDVYKIHAGELSNPGLLRHAAMSARRIDLCIGASRLEEIQKSIEFLSALQVDEIWLMYGFQSFPTPVEEAHLEYMRKLGHLFELPVGYQDHCDAEDESAFWVPAAALGMGIDILEKHLTYDRSRRGADYQAALNPDEFRRFVQMVRSIELARGSSLPKPFSEGQQRYRSSGIRVLVAKRDLHQGARLEASDLVPLRSLETGVTVAETDGVIGRVLLRDVPAFSTIRSEDLR